MIVSLEFIAGRFHATPWGRHVNEGVPEWPPSPFRLLRALIDARYRKHDEIPLEVLGRLLSAIAAPPSFRLPRARASHTRSYLAQYSEDPTQKKLVFDGFAVMDRGAPVLVGWPGVDLDPESLTAARKLFGSLAYLGRSESWVDATVLDERPVEWNCTPLEPGTVPAGKEVVSVAGVVPPAVFESRGFVVPASGKVKSRALPWLDALSWGSAETIAHTMNRPPALEPLFYVRDADALDARPTPARRASTRQVDVVRFAAESRVRVPITDALSVGEQVRRNLMGSLARLVGRDDPMMGFSGKDAEGRPLRGHAHVSILPLDEDGDGYIDALLVTSPTPLAAEELRAIDRLHPVRRRNGHPLVLTPVRFDTRSALLAPAKTVVSHTPFAPFLHWRLKRDGDESAWVFRQVIKECEDRGLPRVVHLERVAPPVAKERRFRWLDFRRARKSDSPQPAYGLRLTFAEDVRAPFSLGYGSHFGLGCFVPG